MSRTQATVPTTLPQESEWLRADVGAARDTAVGVDRTANVIRGYVLAEKGRFKNRSRGEFDDKSLDLIVELAAGASAKDGLLSRFTHPSLSADGLGTHLGRTKNVRRDGDKVRGDLHFNPTALKVPPKGGRPLGDYLMELAETDAGAFGSSLVLKADKENRLAADGKSPLRGDAGEPLPPLWRPTALHACDMVGEGEAVHGSALSADELAGLRDGEVRQASELFCRMCDRNGWNRATAWACLTGFRDRLLDLQFGPDGGEELTDMSTPTEAAAAPANPTPAPKPPTNPTPPAPTPKPVPQPKPAPRPAEGEDHGDLSDALDAKLDRLIDARLSQKLADVDAAIAAGRNEQATYRAEREADALAAAHRRIDTEVDAAVEDGRLSPAKRAAKVKFLRALDHATAVEMLTVDGQERRRTQLDLALDELRDADRFDFAPRIPGQRSPGDAVSRERKDELLGMTSTGQAALAARNGAAPNN